MVKNDKQERKHVCEIHGLGRQSKNIVWHLHKEQVLFIEMVYKHQIEIHFKNVLVL